MLINLWPSTKQWQGWSLPSKLTLVGTVATLISLALAVGGLLPYPWRQGDPQSGALDSQVRLVALDAHVGEEFAQLDVKLRNTGQSIAFLKAAELRVTKVWVFELPFQPYAQPATWNYNVTLPLKGAPYTAPFAVSQSIKPNDTDRFTITLANDDGFGQGTIVYLLELTLTYDEDDKRVTSKPILVRSNGRWQIEAAYYPGGEFAKKVREHNKAMVAEISKINALRGDGVRDLLGEWF
jgi:hypothetical protein